MKKLFIGAVFAAVSGVSAADQSVADHYNKTCVVCHASGVANAPKAFTDEWKPRLAKGMDALITSVKTGFNAMPPRGLCNDCTDADYKALITYMSTPKK